MNWVLRILWFFFKDHMQTRMLGEVKRQGLAAYIHALQGTRRLLIMAFAGFLVLQTVMLAGMGALVTAFMLWDYDYRLKLEILFCIFLALFLLPLFALAILLSERLWYRYSGAEKMIEDIRDAA